MSAAAGFNGRWHRPAYLTPFPAMVRRVFAPTCELNVWQWAERNVVLSSQESPGGHGQYRSSLAPATRFVMELFTRPDVSEIIVRKSSQAGITEAIFNIIRYCVAVRPMNILYAIDSSKELARLFRTRLIPSLERCPATRASISEDPDDISSLNLYLRGMWIMGCGGHVAGAVANKAVGLGIIDEADKHAEDVGDEGSIVDLMRERFKTVPGSKLIVCSKPVHESGVVSREFATGTQHKFFMPCPRCGNFEEWVQERLMYSHCRDRHGDYDQSKILEEAYYECGACRAHIKEEDKRRIVGLGEWRQTNFRNLTPKTVSLELTDFPSLFEQATLGHLAIDLLAGQRSPHKMKQVQANRFAKPFKQARTELKIDDILALRGDYAFGSCPWRPDILILASDVQGDVQKWALCAFRHPGDMAVVSWGSTLAMDELLEIAATPVPIVGTEETATATLCFIDEGYKTTQVRDFVLRSEGLFFAGKGRAGLTQVKHLISESKTAHQGREIITYHFDDHAFKHDLYVARIGGAAKIRAGTLKVPPLILPAQVDQIFAEELCSERLAPEKDAAGFTRLRWKKEGGDNDWGDALKIALMGWGTVAHLFIPQPSEAPPATP